MLRLFFVAVRNLQRNRRRTLLSALAVVVGVAAAVFMRGFVNGFVLNNLDDAVHAKAGAIQIHKAGWREADHNMLDYAFPDEPGLRERVSRVPGVKAVTGRLSFEGMLANGTISTMVMATAIDPRTEYNVCPRRRLNVQAGGRAIEAGRPGEEGEASDAVVGSTIASYLGARQDDSLTLQSATRAGAPNAQAIVVRGFLPGRFIFESKRLVTVSLAFAQELLRAEGQVTEYVLAVDNLEQVSAVAAQVRQAVGAGYAVETWETIVPDVRERMDRIGFVLNIIVIVLALLVATGIINTMMMAVFERVREIGTMLAVGVRRRQVLQLFLFEAGVLGALGAAIGLALGAMLIQYFSGGVSVRPPGGDPIQIVPFVKLPFLLKAMALAVVGCVIAAVLPAWRASRLRPVDALRAT